MSNRQEEQHGQAHTLAVPLPVESTPAGPLLARPHQPEHGLLVQLPGFNFQPRGGDPFTVAAQGTVSGGAAPVATDVIDFVAPLNLNLKLARIGFAGRLSWLVYIEWSLLLDGGPRPGYNSMPATMGDLHAPAVIDFAANGGQRVTVRLLNTFPGAFAGAIITCVLTGYTYREA